MTRVFAAVLVLGIAFSPSGAWGQSDAAATYARAEALVRSHEWDRGIAALQPLLEGKQANTKLLNLAGLAYTGKGDRKQANRYFESALEVQPNFVPALKNP